MTKKMPKAVPEKKPSPKPSRPNRRVKAAVAEEKGRTLILFGLDENKRPRAARFVVDDDLGLFNKSADAMDLIICDVKTPRLANLALKLPAGEMLANGLKFVPYIRQGLYDELVEAAGADAEAPSEPPTAAGAPRTFEEIAAGHLVIAQEDLATGWWEAIVFDCDKDTLTLRYRDYPRLPKFNRHRTAVALLSPQASS
jgi:hypothetical protein